MKNELIRRIKEIDAIYKGPVTLRGGQTSDFYVDIKKAYEYPNILNLICEEIWYNMNPKATCIVAMGHGGIIPASVLSLRYNLYLTLIRDKPKNHGRAVMIDGYLPKEDDFIVLVDDVLTSGSSIGDIVRVLSQINKKILEAIVVVRRGEPKFSFEFPIKHILSLREVI